MNKLLLYLLLLLSSTSYAGYQDWTPDEQKMFIASEALITVDWMQSRTIAKHPDQWTEYNRILGRHPSLGKTNALFITELVANYYLTDALGKNRMIWLKSAVIVEATFVIRNRYLGIKMEF